MPVRVTSKRHATAQAAHIPGILPFELPAPPPDRIQKPAGISLCMIVKNEERFLAQCLRSVADVVDEIIIVDTGSTDRTIEIATSFDATVIEREWRDDFAWARNQSIEHATKRWILFLDADEELTPESKPALVQLKDAPAYHDAVWVRCYNESDDYHGTGAMSHALIRVFPNCPEIRFRGMIHEFPTLDGSASGLQGRMAPISIIHHGYLKEVVAERNKGARNLAIVRAAAEKEPNDPFHWFNLGSTAFLVGDYALAREALEKMREINGRQQRGFIPNGLSLLAEVYGDKFRDAKKSEEIARECLAVSPRYANAHFQLGKALVAQKRYDEARQAYHDAIEDGKYAHLQFVLDDQVYVWKAHSEIGSSYVAEGDDVKASEWFKKGLQNAPGVEPLQINLARSLERQQRFDEASEQYRAAFDAHGGDASTVDFVNFLLRRGRGMEALAAIDSAHSTLSDETAAALLVAAAQICDKHGVSGLKYLELAAERAPWSAEVAEPLEMHFRAVGDQAKLERLLELETESEPRSIRDFVRRSGQALHRGDFGRAAELARRGLEMEEDAALHFNAGLAEYNSGNATNARAHLQRIPVGHAAYRNARILTARMERASGRVDEAMAVVSELLATSPADVEAIVLRAELFEARNDLASAERAFTAAMEADRGGGAVALAGFYLRHERYDDAARIANQALT